MVSYLVKEFDMLFKWTGVIASDEQQLTNDLTWVDASFKPIEQSTPKPEPEILKIMKRLLYRAKQKQKTKGERCNQSS